MSRKCRINEPQILKKPKKKINIEDVRDKMK